ncbi:MAG: phosphoribosylformylglycinamidine synthase subunit PurS [Firmicutes bacterium]|nr:phosphoribosylformylglycinamidine synthase subunit PurS [Candidatus Fermentithermobacillaceae bacterium]
MTYKGTVIVTLKESIFDPQGEAVKNSLVAMGFSSVTKVRMGKHIVVYVEAQNEIEAREKLTDMARRLLANPVTETYEISLVEVPISR